MEQNLVSGYETEFKFLQNTTLLFRLMNNHYYDLFANTIANINEKV